MFHMEQSNAANAALERWYNMSAISSISHVRTYTNGIIFQCQIGEYYLVVYESGFKNVFTSYIDLPKTAKNIVRGREWENYSHKMNESRGTKYTIMTSTYERIESL